MHDPVIFHAHVMQGAQQQGISMEEACRRVKEMGYVAVNMDIKCLKEDFEGTMAPLQKAGLRVHCVYAGTDFGLTEDSMIQDEQVMDENVQLLTKCGCKNMLTIAAFLRPEEMDRKSDAYQLRRERVKKAVAVLAQKCREKGIQLVMEDYDGEKAPFCYDAELFDFVSTVPGVTCAFDTGNFMYACENAGELLPKYLPYVTDVHLKDRGLEKNDGSPHTALDGTDMYPVPVGDGVLPMEEMMKLLIQNGYTGAFAAEHFGSGDQMRDMEKSIAFIQRVVRENT